MLVKHLKWSKRTKGGFLGMLAATLGARLLRDMLTGKELAR